MRRDRDAGAFEQPHQLGHGDADIVADRQFAEIDRHCEPVRLVRRCRRIEKRRLGVWRGQRIPRIEAHHGIEHEGEVGDIARHRTFDRHGIERIGEALARHPAWRWTQSGDIAERRRNPQAAAEIIAVREPRLAGGKGHRRAARRSAAGETGVVGIPRGAVHSVGRLRATEFRQIGFAEHDSAVGFEFRDGAIRNLGDPRLEDRCPAGGSDAADVIVVLDDDRQSAQQCFLPCPARFVCALRLSAGPLQAQRRQRIDRRLDDGDPPGRGVDEFNRRQLAADKQPMRGQRAELDEIFRHRRPRHWALTQERRRTFGPSTAAPSRWWFPSRDGCRQCAGPADRARSRPWRAPVARPW